ncbi:Concanavalin A-like lectins/glucanase [Glarea lozoyensis ATCC 20868]|uniref:Concanavalin A-like lectins/glucanase n=1 Tax=Glarea lozoyensis (strain ATCC 20868 / MF5171) TaxID=1116229 RepID=S3DBT0_GLAL2|nr:Concanavalin A-like lectins/glucanase [Glarea lozoyensis ATCC 20868]EPE35882.1 Concanavalin A-like lectins/glucanase [Glarea lozoyensis ATCC 20868]
MFLFTISLCLFTALVVADDLTSCTSFSINGSSKQNFQYYRFYDFRNLGANTTVAVNSQVRFRDRLRAANVANTSWTDDWKIRDQLKEPSEHNDLRWRYTPQNVAIGTTASDVSNSENISTFLSLTASCIGDQTGAEIDFTATDVLYASIRARVRVGGDSSAVAGIFTYHSDTSESDIEILTRDTQSNIHYSNQPTTDDSSRTIPGATFNVTMAGGVKWTDWQTYRLDWLPNQSAWYVNGVQTINTTTNVPREPSAIIFNMWSNGGLFSGRMIQGSRARMDIAWIELLFDTSQGYKFHDSNQETKVCSIDQMGRGTTSTGSKSNGNMKGGLVLPALSPDSQKWILRNVLKQSPKSTLSARKGIPVHETCQAKDSVKCALQHP